jgi:hypothetical protein
MKNTLILLSLIVGGCASIPGYTPGGQNASSVIDNSTHEQIEQTEEIKIASDKISGHLDSVDITAENILNMIAISDPDPVLDSIEKSTESIKDDVDSAQQEQIRISEAIEDLEQANLGALHGAHLIENIEQQLEEFQESDRELRRKALENLHSFITLFFVIGFGMLIAGAFVAFWINGKLGTVILGIGFLTVGFASASQYYLEEIATIGLIILIIGFVSSAGIVAWILIKGKGNENAIKEIVELIEAMKEKLTPKERKEIFGKGNLASRLTSDLTKKIVAEIKIKNGFKK